MKFSQTLLILFFTSIIFVQCAKTDEFLIEKNRVGKVCSLDVVSDIDNLFASDSIVKNLTSANENSRFGQNDEYLIYSKDGKHLLTLVPKVAQDSSSTFKYVEIFAPEFKTIKELSLKTPFKDINAGYMINKVETTLSSATLYIDELNATLTIDKKDLGINSFSTQKVQLEQIPEMAKVKNLTIWFD